jgi:predicted transcriptional regulator
LSPSISPLSSVTRLNSSVKELCVYLYNLSPLEMDLLFIMLKDQVPVTLDQLAEKVDRDKSAVFRALQKLVSLEIVIKETKSLREGGHYHVYSAVDKETFKKETERRVKELQESFARILRKFENDLDKTLASFNG